MSWRGGEGYGERVMLPPSQQATEVVVGEILFITRVAQCQLLAITVLW